MQRLEITFKTSNILFFIQAIYIFTLFLKNNCSSYQIFLLPSKKNMISLLNSPHVHRNSQKQFYISFYKAVIIFKIKKSSKIQKFLFLSLTNLGIFFNIKIFS